MSILKRALGIIVLTVLIAVGTSLTVYYSYDKTNYTEQVHTELQRQSFAIKTELTTVLKTGSASDLAHAVYMRCAVVYAAAHPIAY
jgi:flagellar basal body-associated protein FliL